MKTALDLPDDLMKRVKIRAVQRGMKLKDMVADLLRRGLDTEGAPSEPRACPFVIDPITGLPIIAGGHPAAPGQEMTPERVAQIMIDQEVEWLLEANRQ